LATSHASSSAADSERIGGLGSRATVGVLGARFGDQVVQMLGAAEHRSERIR
jgi:hypothetical protein